MHKKSIVSNNNVINNKVVKKIKLFLLSCLQIMITYMVTELI